MQYTVYAQISGLAQKANVISESPQWGDNSKVDRNTPKHIIPVMFQSPHWWT